MNNDKKSVETINAEASAEASSSSEEQKTSDSFVQEEDLMSTLEYSAPEEKTSEEDAKETDEKAAADKAAADKAEIEATRFDKHPRFQELNERTKRSEAGLKKANEIIAQLTAKKEELDFDNLVDMTDEQIKEQMDENPKSFMANFARQIRHETTKELTNSSANKEIENSVNKTYETFAEKNEDFNSRWDSGEIKTYMDANPGHNAISAYMILKEQGNSNDVKSQIDAAVKEAVARVRKEFVAKGNIPVRTSRASARVNEMTGTDFNSPQMKDPKKFGGITNVLAQRSAARRKQA
ncbi:MAG: hypothetical protein ISR65_18440 [Bacteriovoracaceae bacterium]|nr:hypothetical protein [Bacteriovoracaceae bacterium]